MNFAFRTFYDLIRKLFYELKFIQDNLQTISYVATTLKNDKSLKKTIYLLLYINGIYHYLIMSPIQFSIFHSLFMELFFESSRYHVL